MKLRRLPQSFCARDALVVAPDLLGKHLKQDGVLLRITEVEAYRHPGDTANHCRFGKTERNAAMWGPPGHAYVYLCYGIHWMLNIVTDYDGAGAAVLIRSAEPVRGISTITDRRRGVTGPLALAGPGKLAQALGLDRSFNGAPLYKKGRLELCDGPTPTQILAGPRVGIDYATPEDRAAAWRFADALSSSVTQRKLLRPLQSQDRS